MPTGGIVVYGVADSDVSVSPGILDDGSSEFDASTLKIIIFVRSKKVLAASG